MKQKKKACTAGVGGCVVREVLHPIFAHHDQYSSPTLLRPVYPMVMMKQNNNNPYPITTTTGPQIVFAPQPGMLLCAVHGFARFRGAGLPFRITDLRVISYGGLYELPWRGGGR